MDICFCDYCNWKSCTSLLNLKNNRICIVAHKDRCLSTIFRFYFTITRKRWRCFLQVCQWIAPLHQFVSNIFVWHSCWKQHCTPRTLCEHVLGLFLTMTERVSVFALFMNYHLFHQLFHRLCYEFVPDGMPDFVVMLNVGTNHCLFILNIALLLKLINIHFYICTL